MTIHTTTIGNSIFYINRTKEGAQNYNRVIDNGRTFTYQSGVKYYKALQRAKKKYFKN